MSIGFALDVDGVLRRDKHAIPGAKEAITALTFKQIPYILLSNSGVVPEFFAQELERTLGFKIPSDRIINTSTVALDYLNSRPKEAVVLIVGAAGLSLPIIKQSTHRNCIFTMQAIMRHHVGVIQGFCDVKGQYEQWLRESKVTDADFPINTFADDFPTHIDEILFCNDSNTWYLDIQVLTEVLVRNGSFSAGTPNGSKLPPIYVTNPDISYGGSYIMPRLTLGSLLVSMREVYRHMAGKDDLQIHYLGKPHDPIFMKAQQLLATNKIYMVGDSLTSDIAGANRKKKDGWISVLVFTGHTKKEHLATLTTEEHAPALAFDSINDAVAAILHENKITI